MKKLNFFSAIVLVAGLVMSSFAQGQSCDTLRNYTPGTAFSAYTIDPTKLIMGHMTLDVGTDTYQFTDYAEKYTASSATTVKSIRFLPTNVPTSNGTAVVTINIYDVNGSEPGTVLGSQDVSYADLTQGRWNLVEFDNPVSVTGDFYAGFSLSYTNYPADLFGIATSVVPSGFTLVYTTTVGGVPGTYEEWDGLNTWITSGSNPLETAFAFEVLTSNGTAPTAAFTVDNADVCMGGSINVDASTSTGTIDVYNWSLSDYPYTADYFDFDGLESDVITPTTATPSAQAVWLIVHGACSSSLLGGIVTVQPAVDATVTATNGDCTTPKGSVAIAATGGDNSYLYSIDGGTTTVPTGTFNNLDGGTYNVEVTTLGNGCVYTEQVTLTEAVIDDASFAYTSNTICIGGGNETPTISGTAGGAFTATPSGLVIDASTGVIADNSAAGTYDVTYATTGACPDSKTKTVTITANPDAAFTYAAAEFCQSVATATPVFTGGASAGAFTSTTGLVIDAATGVVDLASSAVGAYVVTNTIAASSSCLASTATSGITIKASPTVVAGNNQIECEGASVTLTATGADSYTWDNSVTNGVAFTPGVGSINYTVTGTTDGCSATDQVTVNVTATPTVNAGADDAICTGSSIALTAVVSGGTVTWDNSVADGVAFTPTATTTYTATVDDNGCTASDAVTITVNTLPTVSAGNDQTVCDDDVAFELIGTPATGTFTGAGVTGNNFDPATAGEGAHTVTYTYTDGNGCANTATRDITVDGCASVDKNALNKFTVSPNPASDYIEVRVEGNNKINSVQLISLDGKVVPVVYTTIDNQTTQIDVSSVANGTYFIQLSSENGKLTRKVIVQ